MPSEDGPPPRMTAVLGARVITGLDEPPLEDACVLIEGDRIKAVGGADTPPGAERIDAAGLTVLPGLIDSHMHVTGSPESLDTRGHLDTNLKGVRKLRQCLAWGTTTVVNMGGCPESVALREAIDAGHVPGCARMLVAGLVNATGGHVRGRAADGPWEVRRAVREMVTARVDLLKTAATGGFMWEHERVELADYTYEELRALAAEAHAKDKRVAVHAHSQPGLDNAIEAGCDLIHHAAIGDEAALEGILAKDLWLVPTLYITSDPVIANYAKLHPPYMAERMRHAHPIHRRLVRRAHEMGVKLAVGTDGGPGSVMKELGELVACGLTPAEALRAATARTAESLGLEADLFVIAGDPLGDIASLTRQENVRLVMKEGRVEYTDETFKQHLRPRELVFGEEAAP